MWYLFAAIALTTATSADATATRLDGTSVVGRIESWRDDRLVLATAEGRQPLPVADLLSVRVSPTVPPTSTLPPILITVDGTIIPIDGFGASSRTEPATVDILEADAPQTLNVPLRAVRAVRLQPLDAAVAGQWREILSLTVPNDLLVVGKRGGKNLDYLEGVVGEITEDAIEFTLDGAPLDVPRSKVAGLVFYRPRADSSQPPCVLYGRDELRLPAKTVHLESGELHVATTGGIVLRWPLELIHSADFSAGKVVFLSDVEPVSQSWQPLVGLPAAATNLARLGQPRFDQSAAGGVLSLWYPDESFAEGSGSVQSFEKGIAIRSHTELVFRLPRGFNHFMATAGIEPSTRSSGNVTLAIFGDDRPLLETTVSGRDAPLLIDLDVANVRRLRVVVDYGDNLDTGDWLNLCSARIVK